jgi:hypothetical protein
MIKWPELSLAGSGPTRVVGARVVLVDGIAAAYLRRGERQLLLFLPDGEPQRSRLAREVARMLLHLAMTREEGRRGMLIAEINGEPARAHSAARLFIEEGFVAGALGLQARPPGTSLAGRRPGGAFMAEPRNDNPIDTPRSDETRESEHDRVRNSNDRDQSAERAGETPEHNRGYDEAVRGGPAGEDVDPDSAEADVDRDDTVAE